MMTDLTQGRLRAFTLFAAPVTFVLAIMFHPFLMDELDTKAAAAAVMADPTRWAVVHVLLMAAFAALLLAIVALRNLLRTAGEEKWSFIALPLLVGGSTIFIAVWGFEITVAAVAIVEGDVEAVFKEADRWFGPIGIVGYVMYILGWSSMALAVRRSKVLGRKQTWLVLGATVVLLGGLSFPSTAGAYLFAVGLIGFTWVLGFREWSGAGGLSSRSI